MLGTAANILILFGESEKRFKISEANTRHSIILLPAQSNSRKVALSDY